MPEKKSTSKLSESLRGLGRPVVLYPRLSKVVGGTKANIFLTQLHYWTGKQSNPEGWIYKTAEEIEDETGLSYEEQKQARKKLIPLKLLEENYARLEHRMYFRVNSERLDELWEKTHSREQGKAQFPNKENPYSGTRENPVRNEHRVLSESTYITPPTPSKGDAEFSHSALGQLKENDIPLVEIISHLNECCGTAFPTGDASIQRLIRLRWREGYREEDFRLVNEFKCKQWKGTNLAHCQKPSTLWGSKFAEYLAEARKSTPGAGKVKRVYITREEYDAAVARGEKNIAYEPWRACTDPRVAARVRERELERRREVEQVAQKARAAVIWELRKIEPEIEKYRFNLREGENVAFDRHAAALLDSGEDFENDFHKRKARMKFYKLLLSGDAPLPGLLWKPKPHAVAVPVAEVH